MDINILIQRLVCSAHLLIQKSSIQKAIIWFAQRRANP